MLNRITGAHVLFFAMLVGPAALCGTGCLAGDSTGSSESMVKETPAAVIIDENGDGKTFEVIEGQQVIVRLPGNPTTGYEWTVASTDKTFGYPAESTYLPESKKTGSGGLFEFVWETSSPLSMVGKHKVELQYKRSWETAAIDTFTFTVKVVSPDEPTDEPVVIDETSDGKTVDVTEGTDLVVRLAGNATTGYAWTVVSTDKTFGYPVSDDYIPDDSGATGSGGVYEFVWATTSPLNMVGKHTVTLEYKRSWENTAIDTFTFTVNIEAAQ